MSLITRDKHTIAHATMKLLTMRTKVEKKNIIIHTNKQT